MTPPRPLAPALRGLIVALLVLAALRYLAPLLGELYIPGATANAISVDDSFYVQSLARNLARDGRLHIANVPTDGFQPLIVFVRAALALVTPGLSPRGFIVLSFVLQAALLVASGALMRRWYARATGDTEALGGWLAVALLVSSRFVFLAYINPLETLLNLALLLGFFTEWHADAPRAWRLGLLGGLCFLARTDFVLALAALGLVAFLRDPKATLATARAPSTLAAGALGAFVAAPWLLYCKLGFGAFMPRSGAATTFITYNGAKPWQVWTGDKLANLVSGVLGNVSMLGASRDKLSLVLGLVGLPLTVLALRRAEGPGRTTARTALAFLAIYGLVYSLFLGSMWDTWRYLLPLTLWMVPVVAQAVVAERVPRALSGATLVVLVALSGLYTARRYRGQDQASCALPLARAVVADPRMRDVEVGAFNSGALSWLHPRGINLDGKINHSAGEALHARPPTFSAWLDARGIDWFADNLSYLQRYYHGPDRWEPVTLGPGLVVYHRQRATP